MNFNHSHIHFLHINIPAASTALSAAAKASSIVILRGNVASGIVDDSSPITLL